MTVDVLTRLAIAGLGGLLVGVEREWSSKSRSRTPRFAGLRTFVLLGLLGGLAAQLHASGMQAAGLLLLGVSALLVVAAYVVSALRDGPDGTTEVAALVVLGTGFLAGNGQLALASAVSAVTALVLVEKTRLHGIVERIHTTEIEAGARFAVLALVILPLLPEGPFGPAPGIRPRELWGFVLLFSGLSFAGHLAVRIAGPDRGYGIAGLLGGLVSSTAVTLNFSRESRTPSAPGASLAFGVLAACVVLFGRVLVIATALNPPVGLHALRYFALPFLVGVVILLFLYRRRETGHVEVKPPEHPLRLLASLQLAILLQLVLYGVDWVKSTFGSEGILTVAAILGLTDMDALTLSMARLQGGASSTAVAARALAIGIVSNTVLKLVLAVSLGSGSYRVITGGGLAVLGAATILALLIA